MARFTQYIGLSKEACDFLDKHEHKELGYYHMTEGIAMEEVSGRIIEVTVHKATEEDAKYGDFMDTVRLFVEVVQAEPWDSGPMIFTCLMDIPTGEKKFLWSDEDIDKAS